jgi:hypothetical protein
MYGCNPRWNRVHCWRSSLKTQLSIVFLSLLFCGSDAFGQSPDAVFIAATEAALEKLDATDLDDDWYFSMELAEKDELKGIRSDPRRDKYDRRQLLTVNGIPADTERQREFRETEVKRIDGLDPEATGYRYMVDTTTLQLVEQGDSYAKLSFIPRIKAMEESRDQIRGVILLNVQTQQIEEIDIHNTEKLSPAFSVTVDAFQLTLKFQPEQGENLLKKLESHAAGKAGFLKSFDNLVVVEFSDYKRAEP